MATFSFGAELPVPPDEAFSFVSDPTNWPLFIDNMTSAEALDGWGAVGGTAVMTNRFFGRSMTAHLTLTEWEAPTRFRYVARQEGRPDLDNLRVFEAVEGGTRLRGMTTATRRRGIAGLSDRFAFRAVGRMVSDGMARLPGVISQRSGTAS